MLAAKEASELATANFVFYGHLVAFLARQEEAMDAPTVSWDSAESVKSDGVAA